MNEGWIISTCGLGLIIFSLALECSRLRKKLYQTRKVLGQVIKNQDVMAVAIGTDVKQLRERVDNLERDK